MPERDAHTYLAALDSNPARTPGSHQLHLIQGADHMYRGATQPVVERICSWYAQSPRHAAAESSSKL